DFNPHGLNYIWRNSNAAGNRGHHSADRYGGGSDRADLRTYSRKNALGKTIPSAIEQGFAHAFVTIIDTHVTTIVSSLFLYAFGAGPIRGFAVTLVLGRWSTCFRQCTCRAQSSCGC